MKKILALALSFTLLAHPIAMANENRMASSLSAYLRLHKNNPIDWYEWGEEALAKAKRENKPLFISIGYFSCHWRHVMNEETFMSPEVGKMLNEHFVSIKIDRQERPDLDRFYMTYVNMTTGGGGWPTTIFATADGIPFFGGTFFPADDSRGMTGLLSLAPKVAQIFKTRKEEINKNSASVTRSFQQLHNLKEANAPDEKLMEKALALMRNQYDPQNGGFGSAPKFPQETNIKFILEYEKSTRNDLTMIRHTLDKMAAGGVYDQVGGGFHRYSVDESWSIPHFEKMLYNNAQLQSLYISMYRITKDKAHLAVAKDIAQYSVREMYRPGGGFYSASDADDPDGEGAYYSWSLASLEDALGKDGSEIMAAHLGVGQQGNFTEDKSVPHIAIPIDKLALQYKMAPSELSKRIDSWKSRLYEARSSRRAPALEKQTLCSWSAMMARAFVALYTVTGKERDLSIATKTVKFIETNMTQEGTIRHSYSDNGIGKPSFLTDYAQLIAVDLDIFEATQDDTYLGKAKERTTIAQKLFGDDKNGGFFMAATTTRTPVVQQKDFLDEVVPAGASTMAMNLLRLYALTGEKRYDDLAGEVLGQGSSIVVQAPMMAGTLLSAMSSQVYGMREFALVGEATDPAVKQALS